MSPFPFRNPVNYEDSPEEEEWKPPSYAKEVEPSTEWKPPSYATAAKEEEKPKKSLFSRISDTAGKFADDIGKSAEYTVNEGSKFLDSHPKTKEFAERFLTGTSPKTEELFKKEGVTDVKGPGLTKIPGTEKASEYIREKGRNTGNYWGGVAGSVIGDAIDLFGIGDPRAVALGEAAFGGKHGEPPSGGGGEPPVRQSKEVPYRMEDINNYRTKKKIPDEPIKQPIKPNFVNPFEKPAETAKVPDDKPLPIRSPNLDRERFPEGIVEPEKGKVTGITEDKIYDLAKDRFDMGKDNPDLVSKEADLAKDTKWNPPDYATPAKDTEKVDWTPPDYAKAPEEPKMMKVPVEGEERPNIAIGPKGTPPRLMDIIGNSLYTKDRPLSVAKENLQNSFDEHRIIGQKKPIIVVRDAAAKHPITGEEGSSVTVRDHGRGLGPEDLYTLYTDLSATGKGGVDSASGGFGIAKAAPFLSGKYAKVESVVEEGRNKVKYSFEGDPQQLKDQVNGVQLHKEFMPKSAPTGMRTTTFFDKDTSTHNVSNAVRNITENSPSITSPVHMIEDYSGQGDKYLDHISEGKDPSKSEDYDVKYMHENKQVYKARSAEPIQDTIDLPEAKINIHFEDNPKDTTEAYNLHLLNKGMYQDTARDYYGTQIDNVPTNITADIISKVEEGDGKYPFGMNREGVSSNVSRAINEWISKNIISGAREKQLKRLKELYTSLADFPVGNTRRPAVMYDAGGRLDLGEKASFYTSPVVHKATQHFDALIDDIVRAVDTSRGVTSRGDKLEGTGLLLGDKNISGIHIPNPDKSAKSTILINWLAPMETKTPEETALYSTITAMHEAAHISPESSSGFSAKDLKDRDDPRVGKYLDAYIKELDQQGGLNAAHAIDFVKRLGEVFTQFGPKATFEAVDKFHGIITDETGGYNPAVKKLLQIYKDSRGRPETTEDLLSPTGVKQGSSKGGSGDVPPGDQSVGKRPSSALGKLFSALDEAKDRTSEQEALNRVERGKRFAAFGSVKDEGALGAAKSLSKLRGQFEKVNPGEGLKLGQEDTDSLFTAVKQANITSGEKARGYTALFKLLNGETNPVRSELKILDDVFGGGFADKIVEMHGGIGMVGLKVSKLVNTMKSMENAMSLAAPLRHGIGLAARKEFYPAFADMFKFFGNKEYFNAAMDAIENKPNYLLGRDAGLFIAKTDTLASSEEEFLNSYVGKIPIVRDVVGASQRGYTGFLNKLRSDTFDAMIKQAKSLGHETSISVGNETSATDVSKAIARYINNATGRGSLGSLNKMTNELNMLLWSPRMISSRLNMLANPKIYTDLPKGMRLDGLKSLLGIAALGTMVDTLAAYGGAKISTNILSSDYGKSRFGTHVIDPWGGFQQFVVAGARFLAGKTDSTAYPAPSRLDIAGRFAASKESPAASLAHVILTAKKFTGNANDPATAGDFTTEYGQKTSVQREVAQRFLPIFVQDIEDLAKNNPKWSDDIGLNTILGIASLAGMSQNYPEKKATSKFKFKKLK